MFLGHNVDKAVLKIQVVAICVRKESIWIVLIIKIVPAKLVARVPTTHKLAKKLVRIVEKAPIMMSK